MLSLQRECHIFQTARYSVLDTLTVVVQGDLDGDGKVRIDDARKALRAAVGLEIINEFQSLAADIDKNGKVQIPDVRTVLRVAVGLQTFSE